MPRPSAPWLALLGAVPLVACGDATPPPVVAEGVHDLLQRPVRRLAATDARLVVDPVSCLGERDQGGWRERALEQAFPARTYAVTYGREAAVLLRSTGPAVRDLQLVLWAEEGAGSVTVRLNGADLGTHELGSRARRLELEPPDLAWLHGDNLLTLELEPAEGASRLPVLALEEVVVSPAEELAVTDTGLEFDPGTVAGWTLELAGPGILDLTLGAAGAGTAVVTVQGARDAEVVERRRIPLAPDAPTPARLHLPAPPPGGAALELTLAWEDAAEPLTLSRLELFEEQPLERPPILFLSIDTLAAQNLSLYGYDRPTTPELQRFAEDAVLFEGARSNAPWTVPSYASQFTGLYPHSSKLSPNKSIDLEQRSSGWRYYEVVEERWTLTEALQAAGYRTVGLVDNLWLTRLTGFRQGFEVFDVGAAKVPHNGRKDGGADYVLPRALEELRADAGGRPPFVFAHMFDVHGPYLAGEGEAGRFRDTLAADALEPRPVAGSDLTLFGTIPRAIARGPHGTEPPGAMAAEPFQADYDEAILTLDAQLGAFFDDLREAGLYDDLLIVVSADHGESMVDHDYWFSHGLCYESTLHVPLLVKLPGQAGAGQRVADPVQLVDLYPTLLELVGLPHARPELHGRSLVPALGGEPLEPVPQLGQADILEQRSLVLGRWKVVVSQPERTDPDVLFSHPRFQRRLYATAPDLFVEVFGGPPPLDPNQVAADLAALRERDPALNWRAKRLLGEGDPVFELFDLEADPTERFDLSEPQRLVLDELLVLLTAELARSESARSTKGPTSVVLPPELAEELRRLGYLGDD